MTLKEVLETKVIGLIPKFRVWDKQTKSMRNIERWNDGTIYIKFKIQQ